MTYVQAPPHRLPQEGESLFRTSRPDYVVDENGCWIWQKQLLAGYGIAGGPNWSSRRAHRLYYERAYGPIPDGHHIHHLCRVPACVNPEHLMALEERTHHIEDFLRRDGRSIEFVKQIRDEGRKVGASVMEVAARYGVHHKTVQFYWGSVSWAEFLDDGPVVTPRHVCHLPECDNVCVGNRHKKFCCATHRTLHNNRKPEQVAKKSERQRRRRAALAAALGQERES